MDGGLTQEATLPSLLSQPKLLVRSVVSTALFGDICHTHNTHSARLHGNTNDRHTCS